MGIVFYQESKMKLGPLEFVKDVLSQTPILEMDGYEQTKQIALCCAAIAEAMKITNEITEFDKKEIKELILSRFKRLSINEIYYAFKLERFNEYQEQTSHWNRLDASYVAQILKKYQDWKIKVRRDYNLEIAKPVETSELSQEEKNSLVAQGILRVFADFQVDMTLKDGDSYIYETLYSEGYLPTEKEEKIKIYEEAKEVLRFELISMKPRTRDEKSRYRKVKDAIEAKKHPIVVLQAKNISVNKFFRSLINDEIKKKSFEVKYQNQLTLN